MTTYFLEELIAGTPDYRTTFSGNKLSDVITAVTQNTVANTDETMADCLLRMIRTLRVQEKGPMIGDLRHPEKMALLDAFLDRRPEQAERLVASLKRENNSWRLRAAIAALLTAVFIAGFVILVALPSHGIIPAVAASAAFANIAGLPGALITWGSLLAAFFTFASMLNLCTFDEFKQNEVIAHVEKTIKAQKSQPSTSVDHDALLPNAPPTHTPAADRHQNLPTDISDQNRAPVQPAQAQNGSRTPTLSQVVR